MRCSVLCAPLGQLTDYVTCPCDFLCLRCLSVCLQYFISLFLLYAKFSSWLSLPCCSQVPLLLVILVTATGNRVFLPFLQAFMEIKTVEALPHLCSINPVILISMQLIPYIFFSDDSCCCLMISCCVVRIFLGTVPKADCQAFIWSCPK